MTLDTYGVVLLIVGEISALVALCALAFMIWPTLRSPRMSDSKFLCALIVTAIAAWIALFWVVS